MNNRFIQACRQQPVDATPVWFMRQAGRYMSAYRKIRAKHSLLDICRAPELAVEVTLQPVDAIAVDAAILFSDLLLPLVPMGIPFDFQQGEGPVIHEPIRSTAHIKQLHKFDPREDLAHVMETIKLLASPLRGRVPLIGFAGAPFTLASYAIEGGSSRNYAHTKALMYEHPKAWHQLADLFASIVSDYLSAQIEAGVQAVQLFDSWVGALSPQDYSEFALPHTRKIFENLSKHDVPTLHFGTGTSTLLPLMRQAGGNVIGLDWRIPLNHGWTLVGYDRSVQGNLDPTMLLGPTERMLQGALDVLRRANGRSGHIFNVGHGILPNTPLEHVQLLADFVHKQTE
ncbi:MAG: uroporphyrinogen decarboxylase [Acidobacteria bacterium]|nr:uroporphyrinogen decarboxylase [Acidobacteriota bacterium]